MSENKQMEIRMKIKQGDLVIYKKKKYVVIDVDFDFGGHFMIVQLIHLYNNWSPLMRFVKELWDDEIEKLTILNTCN